MANGPELFGWSTFDLGRVRGPDRPHVSVEVAQFEFEPPAVLLEVSAAGVPVLLEPAEAGLTAAGLVRAAAVVEVAREVRP